MSGTDPDQNPLTYTILSVPAHGTLTGTPPQLRYQPAPNQCGEDSFKFAVSDRGSNCSAAVASVAIIIQCVNDGPLAHATVVPPVALGESVTNYWVISPNNRDAYVLFEGSLSADIDSSALDCRWFEVLLPAAPESPTPPASGKKKERSGWPRRSTQTSRQYAAKVC